MKKLTIMRGIPGSGKSHYTRKYPTAVICSADNYFKRPDGFYDFNFRVLKNAHAWCRKKVECAMAGDTWGPSPSIIVDNTNTRHWEYAEYLKLADKYGYDVETIVIGDFDDASVKKYAERNTHGVPVDKVIEMAQRFEL